MPLVVRKQRPPALTNYRQYKPYLRLDFEKRCAYCHIPELRYGTPGNFHIDHFRPKSHPGFRDLICQYSNLYYVCRDCNTYKGSAWPADALQDLGFFFLDPCTDDLAFHWTLKNDGSLYARTRAAEYMIARLNLNRAFLCEWRRGKLDFLDRIETLRYRHPAIEFIELLDKWERDHIAEFGAYWR